MQLNTKLTFSDVFYLLSGFRSTAPARQKFMVVVFHVCCWILFFGLIPLFFRISIPDRNFIYKESINKACLVAFFYLNYFVIVPGFLLRKKFLSGIGLLLIAFLLLVTQHFFTEKSFFPQGRNDGMRFMQVNDMPFRRDRMQVAPGAGFRAPSIDPFRGPRPLPPNLLLFVAFNVFYPWLFFILFGGLIHMVRILLKNQDEKKALETANLKAEINLLKSQVNPHFLFNTLNGIYSQVYHNSENAGGSILKLSEILRYVIYDSSGEQTLLSKDLHYISNYIALQKIRLPEKVRIDYRVEGDLDDLRIAPLLLITFIENSFKHGISYFTDSVIKIHISVSGKYLFMYLSNPVIMGTARSNDGIGLANAGRRLELLYPGKYSLAFPLSENEFIVNLKIDLSRD